MIPKITIHQVYMERNEIKKLKNKIQAFFNLGKKTKSCKRKKAIFFSLKKALPSI